ncbi:uncharacterized protein VTP21DRAFT_604 [Calcarisporiella thermophila]|uniref:uncharacterized protein n=1 Tax=Calcarisporiella thermophila TaxID=911321 RepID=UPI00374437C1
MTFFYRPLQIYHVERNQNSLTILIMFRTALVSLFATALFATATWGAPTGDDAKPVSLELFVMSRCPDARRCEALFTDVLKKVTVPVDFAFNYVAKKNETDQYGATCKHGAIECLGNIQQLCFHEAYPEADWLRYANCMNAEYESIGREITGEALAQKCAIEQEKDFAPIKTCIESGRGEELHLASIERTVNSNITLSCSVVINGKLDCIIDGGIWKQCQHSNTTTTADDFANIINSATSDPVPRLRFERV